MTLQAISDEWAVSRLEEMCRFALAAEYLLCEEAAGAGHPAGHNSHLHVEQLAKTLTTLRHMYADLRCGSAEAGARAGPAAVAGAGVAAAAGQGAGTGAAGAGGENAAGNGALRCPNEPEMLCYQLLLRLDTHGPFRKCEGVEFLRDLRGTRPEILHSEPVRFALDCWRAYSADNAPGFFRLVKSKRCTYLQACCLHKYFAKMRIRALEVVNATHNKSPLAMAVVGRDMLACGAPEVEALAAHCRLAVAVAATPTAGATDANGGAAAGGAAAALAVKEAAFVPPSTEFPVRRSLLVETKAPSTKSGLFRWEALITGKVGC
jgi:hypothetical protein